MEGHTRYRCITYHAKGFCFDNCGRKYDHIQLGSEDPEIFHEWRVLVYARGVGGQQSSSIAAVSELLLPAESRVIASIIHNLTTTIVKPFVLHLNEVRYNLIVYCIRPA